MPKEFEVRWEGVLPADPQQVWDAFTAHTAGWIWEIDYEPRVGGAERGLAGGTVTEWDPPRHFQTRAERPDGWRNALDYTLEPRGDGTLLRFVHTGVMSDYDNEYDQCVQHTAFYNHSLGEYLRHFAGRDAAYVAIDAPGSFAAVCRRLGLPDGAAAGDRVRLAPQREEGTIDYRTPAFLGGRTADALVRVVWPRRVGRAGRRRPAPVRAGRRRATDRADVERLAGRDRGGGVMPQYAVLIFERVTPEELPPEVGAAHGALPGRVAAAGGRILAGMALQESSTATAIRGELLTDGPFIETKEELAGSSCSRRATSTTRWRSRR